MERVWKLQYIVAVVQVLGLFLSFFAHAMSRYSSDFGDVGVLYFLSSIGVSWIAILGGCVLSARGGVPFKRNLSASLVITLALTSCYGILWRKVIFSG
jgi:hypothetical protein